MYMKDILCTNKLCCIRATFFQPKINWKELLVSVTNACTYFVVRMKYNMYIYLL